MKKILIRMKDESIKFVIKLWNLNWEAKLGIFILLPPIWSVYSFFFIYDMRRMINFTGFSIWIGDYRYKTYIEPLAYVYLGLMAIAGAYLIRSNQHSKNDK